MTIVRIAALAAVVLAVTALAGAGRPEPAQGQAAEPAEGGITVTGTGSVATTPDRAELVFGVVTEGDTARAAMTANAAASRRLVAALRAAGIAAEDIQTQQVSLSPRYSEEEIARDGSGMGISGYTAQTSVSAGIRQLDRAATVIDAAVAAGANSIAGPSLIRSDAEQLYRDALERAVADARQKAKVLADAGDVTLGAVVSLVETGAAPVVSDRAKLEAADAPSIEPGTQEIVASVTVTFALGS